MTPQDTLNHAVWYAVREGCFFPVPRPSPDAPVHDWVQWGAMQYLHTAIAEFYGPHQAEVKESGT